MGMMKNMRELARRNRHRRKYGFRDFGFSYGKWLWRFRIVWRKRWGWTGGSKDSAIEKRRKRKSWWREEKKKRRATGPDVELEAGIGSDGQPGRALDAENEMNEGVFVSWRSRRAVQCDVSPFSANCVASSHVTRRTCTVRRRRKDGFAFCAFGETLCPPGNW